MNKKALLLAIGLMTLAITNLFADRADETDYPTRSQSFDGEYSIVIEGYDWGPAVNKVILSMGGTISEANAKNFTVDVLRSTEMVEMPPEEASGTRTVLHAYVSDGKGNRLTEGNFMTLVLLVGPDLVLGSPIKYIRQNNRGSNVYIDYQLTVTDTTAQMVWNTEKGRISPIHDKFDLTGTFTHSESTMSYASFEPTKKGENLPLVIWLHGGGEGGTDPSIPLIANRAANYASSEIQDIMGGAYVLVPQSPTFWMQSESGDHTRGATNDIYNEALMELIKEYVAEHPKIDEKRIYVGGCSNGGYMSLKLILQHPDYFAAGYISALAYQNQYITDTQIRQIKNVPIWFVHSKDDQTTLPDETVVPLYKRLIDSGAENVHLSYYDHVIDLSGFYGGDDYYYPGHWSWIYSHANHAELDFDGNPVMLNDKPVSIMEWLTAQSR